MKREVEEKTQCEEAGRAERCIVYKYSDPISLPTKGFCFGSREMNRGEEGSRNCDLGKLEG